jgi:hypothetical protein
VLWSSESCSSPRSRSRWRSASGCRARSPQAPSSASSIGLAGRGALAEMVHGQIVQDAEEPGRGFRSVRR